VDVEVVHPELEVLEAVRVDEVDLDRYPRRTVTTWQWPTVVPCVEPTPKDITLVKADEVEAMEGVEAAADEVEAEVVVAAVEEVVSPRQSVRSRCVHICSTALDAYRLTYRCFRFTSPME
jgi:hypothetical protein